MNEEETKAQFIKEYEELCKKYNLMIYGAYATDYGIYDDIESLYSQLKDLRDD